MTRDDIPSDATFLDWASTRLMFLYQRAVIARGPAVLESITLIFERCAELDARPETPRRTARTTTALRDLLSSLSQLIPTDHRHSLADALGDPTTSSLILQRAFGRVEEPGIRKRLEQRSSDVLDLFADDAPGSRASLGRLLSGAQCEPSAVPPSLYDLAVLYCLAFIADPEGVFSGSWFKNPPSS